MTTMTAPTAKWRGFKVDIADLAFVLMLGSIVVRQVLGGMLRWAFSVSHVNFLWFSFDALMAACFVVSIGYNLPRVRGEGYIARVIILFSYLILSLIMGYIYAANTLMLSSAVKLYLPFVVGATVITWNMDSRKLRLFMAAMLVVDFAFIFVNKYVHYPWWGYSFEQFGVHREATRQWWSSDGSDTAARYAGAALLNVSAADCAVFCAALATLGDRRIFRIIAAYGLAFGVAIIAVQRTAQLAAIIMCGVQIACVGAQWWRRRHGQNQFEVMLMLFAVVLVLLSAVVPAWIAFADPFQGASYTRSFFGSVADRAGFMWPLAAHRINDAGWWRHILGLGLGAIGSPSIYAGEIVPYNSVDNVFLYLYSSFGFFSLPIFYFMIRNIIRSGVMVVPLAFYIAIIGATQNIEDISLMALISMFVFSWYRPAGTPSAAETAGRSRRRTRVHRPLGRVLGSQAAREQAV